MISERTGDDMGFPNVEVTNDIFQGGVLDWTESYDLGVHFETAINALLVTCFDDRSDIFRALWFRRVEIFSCVEDGGGRPRPLRPHSWWLLLRDGRAMGVVAESCYAFTATEPFGDLDDAYLRAMSADLDYVLGELSPSLSGSHEPLADGVVGRAARIGQSLSRLGDGVRQSSNRTRLLLALIAADAGVPYELWRDCLVDPPEVSRGRTVWHVDAAATAGHPHRDPFGCLLDAETAVLPARKLLADSGDGEVLVNEKPIWPSARAYLDHLHRHSPR